MKGIKVNQAGGGIIFIALDNIASYKPSESWEGIKGTLITLKEVINGNNNEIFTPQLFTEIEELILNAS